MSNLAFAQEHSDCNNAITIKDTIYNADNYPPNGSGSVLEFKGNNLYNKYFFQKEHNTVWYKFTVPENSYFTMDIIPVSYRDDYDFLVYKYSENLCNNIVSENIKPIRTNISRNNIKIAGKTGLSSNAKEDYVHAGPGDSYSRGVNVKKGEVYYIVLDNVYDNGKGHKIFLHFKTEKIKEKPIQKPVISETKAKSQESLIKKTVTVNINSVTDERNELLLADFEVIRNKDSKTILSVKDKKSINFEANRNETYTINCSSKNYLNFTSDVNVNDSTTQINQVIKLKPIEIGSSISLDNIYFYGNSAKFISTSDPSLKMLLKFMIQNSEIKIEIQGHVNWPEYKKLKADEIDYNLTLSTNRAKSVYIYLIKNGIDKNRLTFKGYGNTKMLYPFPKNEIEEQKNRRVEILILSK